MKTIDLETFKFISQHYKLDKQMLENMVIDILNNALNTAFAIIENNQDETQRINPTRAVSIERYYSQIRYETRSMNFDWLGSPSQGNARKNLIYETNKKREDFLKSVIDSVCCDECKHAIYDTNCLNTFRPRPMPDSNRYRPRQKRGKKQ